MLNSKLLRQFIAVAEELHFGRAAQRVNIAQSPLSQAIQKLEEQLDVQLFERNKRNVTLTAAGLVFLEEARQWLKYERLAIERTQHARNGDIGHLSMGFIGSVGYGFMPDLITRFRKQYPNITFRLVETTTLDQLEQLQNHTLDVGLLRTPLASQAPGVKTRFYARDRLMVALSVNHPLSNRKRILLKELAQESFVAFSRERVPAAHAQLIAACMEVGFYPNIEQECAQVASMVCIIATGLSVALVAGNLTALMHPSVRYIPLSDKTPHLHQEISVAWREDDKNPALTSLLKVAQI